jgi:predicted nucleic acid-binding Zn ribbon protein
MSEYGGPPTEPQRHCPKCQAPVADNAQFCPNCGNDLTRQRSSFWPAFLIAVVALLVGAGIAYAVASGNDNSTKTVTKRTTVTAPSQTTSNSVTVQTPTRTVTVPSPTVTVTVPSTTPGG